MNIRIPLVVSALLVFLMTAAGLWAFRLLPEGARIAVHWGVHGQANGFAGKLRGLFIIPAVSVALTALFAAIPQIEPRRFNLASSAKFYSAAWIGVLLIMCLVQGSVVATAFYGRFDTRSAVFAAVSVLFLVLGNYMGKSRSNFFAGVRTPWTLSSEYSWEKTNRLGGRLIMAVGALTLLALALGGPMFGLATLIATLVAALLVSVTMSYVYWRRDPDKDTRGAVPE